MKCEESQALAEEYFDGELDELTAEKMSAHLESCESCSATMNQLALEHTTYQRYDRGLDASPALWMRVQEQLDHEITPKTLNGFRPNSSRGQHAWDVRRAQIQFGRLLELRFSVGTSLALVVCAVIVTVGVLKYLNKPETGRQIGQVSSEREKPVTSEPDTGKVIQSRVMDGSDESTEIRKHEARPTAGSLRSSSLTAREKTHTSAPGRRHSASQRARSTPEQLVHEAEKKYLRAIALLTRGVEQRPSRLDSETRMKLDGALAAIDLTILSTRKAVRQNPNDPRAVQYMLTAYGKKVEVLKEISNY